MHDVQVYAWPDLHRTACRRAQFTAFSTPRTSIDENITKLLINHPSVPHAVQLATCGGQPVLHLKCDYSSNACRVAVEPCDQGARQWQLTKSMLSSSPVTARPHRHGVNPPVRSSTPSQRPLVLPARSAFPSPQPEACPTSSKSDWGRSA
jgi:hypothetical protein